MAIEKVSNTAAYQAGNAQQSAPVVTNNVAPVAEVQKQAVTQTSESSKDGSNDGKREASNENIKKAVSDLNKKMSNTICQFGIHEGTNRVTIKILDKETKEVLKEYPAEETLEMIEKVWELAGIVVDKKL